jgi:DNA helicase-2/ATP-dependent DNA helicase PcrA
METINERTEAQYVISMLEDVRHKARTLSECAVLYRTHAQSRALEEALVRAGVPYRIVGGIRFYERKEIKDLLAYLRIIHNPADTVSLERIANVPPRRIGVATIERLTAGDWTDTARSGTAVANFQTLLEDLRATAKAQTPARIIREILKRTQYEAYLGTLKGEAYENIEERMENIRELLTVAGKYDTPGQEGMVRFLEEVALLQDADTATEADSAVTLMTIHAAKGLEFPVVFVTGMEEGLFPHSRTLFAPHELEEERRLCYVAITRAKEHLHLTLCRWRNIFGSRQTAIPSRFLGEIPKHLTDWRQMDPDAWYDRPGVDYDD